MKLQRFILSLSCVVTSSMAAGQNLGEAAPCPAMMAWDNGMAMCMPLAMKDMPMRMAMLRANTFATVIDESGPRGRAALDLPNMFMADAGTSLGASNYLNLDGMGTLERWTFPYAGSPELLQIGEANNQGVPFVDAQHPHSSPIMGLTLSDTLRLTDSRQDFLKLSFAPRGESGDGPLVFMNRTTGMVNPDVPLGHHIGQDVGHISSTVFASALSLGSTQLEASLFNGAEPSPDTVDLRMGSPTSYALRISERLGPQAMAMGSFAYVRNPEPSEPDITTSRRYSASLYTLLHLPYEWNFHNSLIWGTTTNIDHAPILTSFTEEFLLQKIARHWWGRIEVLQRTGNQLEISSSDSAQWVAAATLGYSHTLINWDELELNLGGSLTVDFLPQVFSSAYGSPTPLSAKLFLQVSGMKMWNL